MANKQYLMLQMVQVVGILLVVQQMEHDDLDPRRQTEEVLRPQDQLILRVARPTPSSPRISTRATELYLEWEQTFRPCD